MFLNFITKDKYNTETAYKPVTKQYHFSYNVNSNDFTYMLQG